MSISVGSQSIQLPALAPGYKRTLVNVGNFPVYYGDQNVSATANVGNLSGGQSIILTSSAPLYVVCPTGPGQVDDIQTPTTSSPLSPLPSNIFAMGHSYIQGAMSNPSTNRQTAKLAAACKGTETNKGQGSSILCTHTGVGGLDTSTVPAGIVGGILQQVTAARTPGTDPFVSGIQCAVICEGINDAAMMGPANMATIFPATLHTAIRRIRAGAVFEDSDSSVTFPTGTWGSGAGTTANSGAGNHSTTTNGTAVIAVPSQYQGQAITIGQIDVGQPNTCVVTDETGRVLANFNNSGYSFTANALRRNGYPSIYIPAGTLSPGSHTLTCTYTLSGANAFFDYWSIESNPTPLILIELANRLPNYSIHAVGWPAAPLNDAAIASMNQSMQAVAATYTDGRVICVPTDDILANNPANFTLDGVHPNSHVAGDIANRMWQTIVYANGDRADLMKLGQA